MKTENSAVRFDLVVAIAVAKNRVSKRVIEL
jgi:hypothetical protein